MRKPELIETSEISPCPFCGSSTVYLEQHQIAQMGAVIFTAVARCDSCSVVGPTAKREVSCGSRWDAREWAKLKAIELWNKRI